MDCVKQNVSLSPKHPKYCFSFQQEVWFIGASQRSEQSAVPETGKKTGEDDCYGEKENKHHTKTDQTEN